MASDTRVSILYVGGDPSTALLVQDTLRRAGHAVDLSPDGEKGLPMWERGLYHLLLIDGDATSVSGLEILRILSSREALPPTVVMTSVGNERVALGAMDLGASEYLIKDSEKHYLQLIPYAVCRALDRQRLLREKLEAERALRLNQEMLRNTLAASPAGISYTEGDTIKWANKAMTALFGYEGVSFHDWRGKSAKECYATHAEYDRVMREVVEGSRKGKPVEVTARLKRRDRSLFDACLRVNVLDPTRQDTAAITVISDVTGRMRLEEERLSLATAIEQAAESILITDPDGSIRYVNPAFERLTGYTRKEALGETPSILKSGTQDNAFYKAMWDTLTSGNVWRGRFVNKKKDGTLFEEEATISPVKDDHGNIVSYVAVKRDVSTEVLLEKQLVRAQKMESIGTLAGGIAHDFKNQLQVFVGYAVMLLMDKDEKHPDFEALQAIRQAALSGDQLVKGLLTFSRRVEYYPRPLNLNSELMRLEQMLTRMIPKMINLEMVLSDNLRLVYADPNQIEQVVMNLAVNAHQAMPDGGSLRFETQNITLDEAYCNLNVEAKPGRHVQLTVSDTGHGMERHVMERIFEPFYTTKESGEGTGLGLAMVFGIVKNHGGHVTCYSRPGMGATFKIYLPVIESRPGESVATTREFSAFGTETILVVEDDPRIRTVAQGILTKAGYTVLAAADGVEALRVYRKRQDEIALVILDLVMPKMSGKKCLDNLLRIDPHVKVLISSGLTVTGRQREALGRLCKGFVTKPSDDKQLLKAVRKALEAE